MDSTTTGGLARALWWARRPWAIVVIALVLLAPTSASAYSATGVALLGPATGPGGFSTVIDVPPCPAPAGRRSQIQLTVNGGVSGRYWGDSLSGGIFNNGHGSLPNTRLELTLTTTDHWFGSPEFAVGSYQLGFVCRVESTTGAISAAWTDPGFTLTITEPARNTPVSNTSVTAGMPVSTVAAAEASKRRRAGALCRRPRRPSSH